jgi:hypothetical protein
MQSILSFMLKFFLRERALGFSMTEGALALHVVVQNIVE